jgi:hypothetical protein
VHEQQLQRDTCYVSTIGLSQIAAAQFLHVYNPRHWINCGQAGPLGWTIPAALGVRAADPTRKIVALSGDYDFQFMIEELAVGAQFKLPYLHIVVNNSYLGLIRQAQRGFEMDYCVQLAFDNINAAPTRHRAQLRRGPPEGGRGPGLQGDPRAQAGRMAPAIARAEALMAEFSVPVVIEVMLERVTNIAMGTEIDAINEFEPLAESTADAPTALAVADAADTETRRQRHAQVRSQPHDALHRAALHATLRGRRQGGLQGRGVPVPLPLRQEGTGRRLRANGLQQVLHNLPAGDWDKGERGIACHPDRTGEFAEGIGMAIDYASALGCPQVNCLVGKVPAGVTQRRRNRTVIDNLRLAARELEAAGLRC